MKKRFSSLNLTDLAAWSMAVGTFAFLAAAGLVTGQARKRELPRLQPVTHRDTHPNLTPGA